MMVLQIIADGSPGGGTIHTLQLLARFKDRYSLALVTQKNSYLLDCAADLGIAGYGLEFFRSRLDPQVPRQICNLLGSLKPDLIHAHGGRAAFFCSRAGLSAPMIYTVHGYHFVHQNALLRALARGAERRASRCAKHVIFVCNHDLQLAISSRLIDNETNTSVIPCGIDLFRVREGAPSDVKHIGFIGRLEEQKDPLLMLEVFERLPEYAATMVGGGELAEDVQERIASRGLRLEAFGPLSHDRTLEILSTFGVLVMTSRWEGLPIVAMEAMCAGVPVVATTVGGLPELIENGRSGILVRTRSPDEIAAAVRKLTEDLEFRASIITNARQRVRTLFSEEQMLGKIQNVYREVSGRS